MNPQLGAYRWVTEECIRTRWDKEIPIAAKEDWRPESGFQALINEAFEWDKEGCAKNPRQFRAPNGTLVDLFEAFNRRPLYNPQAIEIPTMLTKRGQRPHFNR